MGKIFIGSKIIPKNTAKELIRCCSCHKYYDFKGNIFSSIKGRILICPHCGLKHKIDFKLFKNKTDNLIKIDKLDLAAIDIGSPAIDGDDYADAPRTIVSGENPANATGKITSVEIWANTNMTGCKVATFFVVSGNNLSTRDYQVIGDVTANSKQTFEVDLDVEEGDYIGVYFATGRIEFQMDVPAISRWEYTGDRIPCTNTAFTYYGYKFLSLYGTGVTIEIKNATGKSSISTSTISVLSRGKIESVSAKVSLISNIVGILSRGKVESVSGKSDITTLIDSLLSRGRIESVNGRVDIASSIISILSKGKIETVSGMASINTIIDAILSRGIIESVNSISGIISNVSTILSRRIIQNVSGKSSFDSVTNIALSKGKVESASGKADIPSDVIIVLNRGMIKDISGTASIMTLMISLLSKGRVEDVSGKSQFDTNVDAILKRIISVNGKTTLNTLYDVTISIGKLFDVKGKADINSLININLKRILNVSGKSIFDTLIEIEIMQEIIFTQATLGITTNKSKLGIER